LLRDVPIDSEGFGEEDAKKKWAPQANMGYEGFKAEAV
jgi:hypothetical protein